MAQPGHRRLRSQHQLAQDQAALAQWNANKWFVRPLIAHRLPSRTNRLNPDGNRIVRLMHAREIMQQ